MTYDDKQIGRNIKAIRNANKMNYFDFATEIGISDSLLEKIESGIRHASDEIIHIISKNTGFSFNDIKHRDLSFLEKGDLYFDDELSLEDFIKSEEFEIFFNLLKILFPFVTSEKALENTEFSLGVQIAHEKIQSGEFSSKDCINAINYFIHAGKTETCADLSAINILSCFGYLYIATFASNLDNNANSILIKRINSLFDFFSGIQTFAPKKLSNIKNTYLEKYNGYLTIYMQKLVKSANNSDYAYYFLCLRYYLGIMDEKITLIDDNQMRLFGESMLDSLYKMGNKYAMALHDFLNC